MQLRSTKNFTAHGEYLDVWMKPKHAKEDDIPEHDISYRYAADVALRQSRLGLFPTVTKAYRLLLTAAPAVCKDERSFSKLKFVKSYCRNWVTNDSIVSCYSSVKRT